MADTALIEVERIENAIIVIRGQKVMLDADLANLYDVPTKMLNQAVRRNADRFPLDFMFRLTAGEVEEMRSHFVTASGDMTHMRSRSLTASKRNVRFLPFAFTEQGVAMLSSVLKSKRAVQVNVEIMRAFVRMRQILAAHADLARKFDALEKKYDRQFQGVFEAIRQLMAPPSEPKKRRRIGFRPD